MTCDNPEQYKWFKPFDIGVAVASMLHIACCNVDKIEYHSELNLKT